MRNEISLPELLAPAGDFPSLDAALDHGADALYAGVEKFNLRAHAPNFRLSDLPELLGRVHQRKRRIYFTFNIIPGNRQILEMERLLCRISAIGAVPDALIVSDPGVISLCRDILPGMPLHLSTQTGAFNRRSLEFWKEQGISRVVLPRELDLGQITELASSCSVETELFIHGAMCVSISGRCLMGTYLAGRHPNYGDCPQPCRWKYRISCLDPVNGQTAEKALDVEESVQGSYLLNSRDLCTIGILPDLIRSGVRAFKIEGRNKSAHYVGTVVKAYRAALDEYAAETGRAGPSVNWRELLETIEHRPYTTGFYTGELSTQEIFTSKASASSRIVGVVKGVLEGGHPVIDVKNSFECSGSFEILPVRKGQPAYRVTFSRCADLNGTSVEYAPSNRLVVAYGAFSARIGDMIRRTADRDGSCETAVLKKEH